ncbi:MAG TPA: hypothetical protein VHS78_03830 [Candidatus Elarobacter sp.]|jgi:hypothetical protein|nr:hypothetical protein [Candidatus Elarobacter sp.]
METIAFVRGMELRALLEATAISRLVETMDQLIADAEARAKNDAIAEHCAASWRRRRDALLDEHAALLSGPIVPILR